MGSARDVARRLPLVGALDSGVKRARFERDRRRRRRRYGTRPLDAETRAVVQQLHHDGTVIIPGLVPQSALDALAEEFEGHLDAGTCLGRAANDASRSPDDLGEPHEFLHDDQLAGGQDACRSLTNFLAVRDPLITCPESGNLALLPQIIDIAAGYLGCTPALGGLNLRKSFVNDLPAFDTLNFHSDPNSARFLKCFIYLHDVDIDAGPFCYVDGSHREKFGGWRSKYRWTPEEIEDRYGAGRVRMMTARAGDVVLADTTGFHRGTKVRARDRSMLTLDYTVHREFGGKTPPSRIGARRFEALSPSDRPIADLLEIVG